MRSYRHTNSILILNLFVLSLLCCLMYWAHHYKANTFVWIPPIRAVTLLLIVYQIIIVRACKLWIFDFAIIFTATNYLFVEGYLFIWEEGYRRYEYWTMGYTASQWLKGFVFGLCYIQGMFTGLLIPNRFRIADYIGLNKKYTSKSLFQIGIVIFLISLPFKFYVDAMTYITNRSGHGYSAVLSNEVVSGVSFNLSLLVNIGVIYVICSRYLNAKKAMWFFLVFFIYALGITALVGGRRFTVTALLAIVPCYIYVYKVKITWKQFAFYALLGYIGIVFLSTVSATREMLVTSFDEYITLSINYLTGADVLFDFVYEFGNTIYPYVMALSLFPSNHNYLYGVSLVAVWILAIPGAGKLFPNLRHDVSATTIAREKFNYWFGGAFGQELYANFGYVSIGISVLTGKLFSFLLGTLYRDCGIVCARYFSLYYALLNLVRSDLNQFVRLILWAYFLPIILFYLFFRKK